MMTKNEINKILAAVVQTLDETAGNTPTPESVIYLAIGCSLDEWHDIKAILINANLATSEFYAMKITPNGRELANKIRSFMATL